MPNTLKTDHPDFQALFEAAPGAYLILTPAFNIAAVSESYLVATMTNRDVIMGRNIFDVFPDNPEEEGATGTSNLRASLDRVLKYKQSDAMAIQKYDIKRPDGVFEMRYWSPVNSPVLNSKNEVTYIIHCVEDVTEIVKLKQERIKGSPTTDQSEKLKQSQRMEAMGQLAGGVAHDFNNLLAVVIMNCEFMLSKENLDTEVKKSFNQIKTTAEKAANLSRQLLTFSRRQVFQPKVINVNTVIHDIQVILKRLTNETISLDYQLSSDLGNIVADPTQIEQILINLIVNARDALPNGGKITVETKNTTLDPVTCKGSPQVSPGPYVMLSVSDDGVGMDAVTQARIFEPFFTTKSAGKGTGLGLATIYGIVSQNKGTIWVYSEIKKGTIFKIYLPRASQPVSQVSTEKLKVSFKRKSARILVIDDEIELKLLMSKILKLNGYEVETASHGAEGLELIQKNLKTPYDLIISDVMMPLMTGSELKEEVETAGVNTEILLISGYAEGTVFDHLDVNLIHFLEKPFTTTALLEKIQSILK